MFNSGLYLSIILPATILFFPASAIVGAVVIEKQTSSIK